MAIYIELFEVFCGPTLGDDSTNVTRFVFKEYHNIIMGLII